jgi:hypothetical protein
MDNIKIINGSLEFECKDVSQAEGFEVPTTRDVFIDPPEREGSLFIGEIAGMRVLSWRGLIRTDIQDNRRLLSRVCTPGGLKTIQFTLCDGVDVQIQATVKLTNPYSKTRSPYLINAKAPYPYFESQTLHQLSSPVTVRRGGLPIPAAIPAPIGEGGGSPFSVTNAGDIFSRPVFLIRGPGTNFTITNTTTGESLLLETSLASNEIVRIDTVTNEAINGVQNVFGLITRDPIGSWITLAPGNNNIVFSAISGSDETTEVTIIWRDTYSGF